MKGTDMELSKKRNAAMIDLVFGLMFDILWLSPYDHRRLEPSFVRFERCARSIVVALRASNGAKLSDNECEDMKQAAAELADSVEQLQIDGIIPQPIYEQASVQVRELIAVFDDAITCGETPSR